MDVSGERMPRAAMPAATAAGQGGLACRLCSTSMNGRCRLFFAACLLPLVACQLVAARGEDPAKLARWPILVVRTTPWEKLAAHPEARVEGVVIRSTPTTLVIQDETGGLYVNISRAIERGWLPGPLEPETAPVGHEVTIEGVLEPGGFAPIIVPRTIALLGPKPLPEPRRKDPAVLLSGGYDSELVELTGIVQAVRKRSSYTVLAMNFREQEVIVALAPDALDIDPNRLLDAEVRLRGVAAATFTPRGEFRDAIVYVEQPGWIEIVVPSETFSSRKRSRYGTSGDFEPWAIPATCCGPVAPSSIPFPARRCISRMAPGAFERRPIRARYFSRATVSRRSVFSTAGHRWPAFATPRSAGRAVGRPQSPSLSRRKRFCR